MIIQNKHRLVYLVLTLVALWLGACSTQGAETVETLVPGVDSEAVLAAQAWVAEQLGTTVEQIEVVSVEQTEWSDSCLGLGQANESCAAVVTPGWRAVFLVDGQEYEVRTDATGSVIRSAQIVTE